MVTLYNKYIKAKSASHVEFKEVLMNTKSSFNIHIEEKAALYDTVKNIILKQVCKNATKSVSYINIYIL